MGAWFAAVAGWASRHGHRILTCVAALAVAVMLYDGLYHLALDQLGWAPWKAPLFPLAIDAMVALAYWATAHLKRSVDVAYAWAVVVFGSLESVTAQVLHTQWDLFGGPAQAPWWAPYMAGAPVLSLVLMLHLLYVEGRRGRPRARRSARPLSDRGGGASEGSVPPPRLSRVGQAQALVVGRPAVGSSRGSRVERYYHGEVRELVDRAVSGERGLTGRIAAAAGVGAKTADRLVKDVRGGVGGESAAS